MEDQGKRLLLAVAVAFAIMVAWTMLFPPEPPERKEAPGQDEAGQVSRPDRGADPPGREAGGAPGVGEPGQPSVAPVAERGPEELITVESGTVRATFSSWGGALKSWELIGDQFHVPGRPDLHEDMVRLGDHGFYSFLVGFDSRSTLQIPAETEWVGQRTKEGVTYTWRSPDLEVEKRFRVRPDHYLLEMDVSYKVLRPSDEQRLVVTLHSYQDPRDVKEGGWTSLPREWKAACYIDDDLEAWGGKALRDREREERGALEWAGFEHSYFLAAASPRVSDKSLICRARPASEEPGGMAVEIVFPPSKLGADDSVPAGLVAYLGPKYLDKLEAISELPEVKFPTGFEKAVDLGFFGFLAGPLLWLLQAFYAWVGSWGIAIILLTILVKLATLYWTHKSMKSMRAMAKLKPQLDKVREKHKDDRQKQQVETMNLFKAHGVNPLAGCLPLILQMPIWFALYRALSVAAELYQAKFLWFSDLTSPDPYFILPVFMTVTMLLQSKLTPTTATGMQQKILMFGMPLMFGGFSLFFPAGLTLYISTNTVLTLLHHLYMRREDFGGGRQKGASGAEGGAGKVEALAGAAVTSPDEGDSGEGEGDDEGAAKPAASGKGSGPGKGPSKRGKSRSKRSKRSSRSS
jgi:YidC/Oxa1 family membrane protein insertase